MKKILVPIDFSKCSKDAFHYATEVARNLNLSLMVIHIYGKSSAPFLNNDQPRDEEKEQELKTQLQQFIQIPLSKKSSQTLTKIKIETEVIFSSDVTNHITQMTKEEEIIMVILGTRGFHNATEKMYGSIASGVTQRSHCPVILIPEGTKYQGFNKIMYASNYESMDEQKLNQIIDFGNLFRTNMHFVHIDQGDNFETVENKIFEKIYEKGNPAFSFNVVNIESKSVQRGLNQYAKENDIDLIVLVNRHRRFFENIRRRSLTQKMAFSTELPLMVFHLLDE